ncbi:DUF3095 domain-containing protein [Methylobacterium frigidaeris]|uniref:Adenylate cyclase n=1 Tax=Methylobacterium frigidaeris TaxID=2038277 RepID=A0AA37HBL4_9HYPH|nr:DUF3095 domain-containing protein [Methylobacterium frigidaeris]PIK70163.1 adenylate cyclase [Methylobacterium frigidaeris]GJD62792.1 hypothetical protein MPEAHAMD_2951 [Methylobacterium frigidaeris]
MEPLTPPEPADGFRYADLTPATDFLSILDDAHYRAVPAEWWVAVTDVVDSTGAIAAGRYRAVNFVGAAVIAALRNALGRREVPFVFGGDGASVLVAPDEAEAAKDALAATVAWARDAMGLTLRAALVPVAAIREAGHAVEVARYAPSPDVAYAMFMGGGLAFAERALKQGLYAVAAAPTGTQPDLTGLTCRFEPAKARHGLILSILVVAAEGADRAAARATIADVVRLAAEAPTRGHPLPPGGPALHWPPAGFAHEVRARGPLWGSLGLRRLHLLGATVIAHLIFRLGLRVGGFSAPRYLDELVANADFRKYDDGLRMTVDGSPDLAARIEARLVAAEAAGLVRFGLHRQAAALTTCITPVAALRDHVHFVDGEDGGYARAAQALKAKDAARHPAADANPGTESARTPV